MLLAVVIATAFFAHESLGVTGDSKEVIEKREKWLVLKGEAKESLKVVKQLAIGTMEHEKYLIDTKAKDIAHQELQVAKVKNKFFQFDNFKQFLGEFDWAVGLFLYSLFNLTFVIVSALIKSKKISKGLVYYHSTVVIIGLFYISWAFMKKDFEFSTYLFWNIICGSLLIFGLNKILKSLNNQDKLKSLINWIFEFRDTTFQNIAVKAMLNDDDYDEVKKEIDSFDQQVVDNVLQVIDPDGVLVESITGKDE